MPTIANLEQAVHEFRRMLPDATATAQAIDRGEPWERIALNAVNDGYIESEGELSTFLQVCLRRSF
jgi:hypothetical protein